MSVKHLHRMAIFARIVDKGSFSDAAKALGLGKSVVSQHLTQLEEDLGVKLLTRSTRSLTLTEEGREYYESCARIVAEAERAERLLDSTKASERGTVRLTCSYNLALNFVVPLLGDFRQLHPDIEIDLLLEDRVLNIVDEGIDVAIRSGWLEDTAHYAITLSPMQMYVCASQSYVSRHGAIITPEEITRHDWIAISGLQHPDRIVLECDSGRKNTISNLKTTIRVNSGLAARTLILAGVGIGLLPNYAVWEAIGDGRLVRICEPWRSKIGTISAIFPSRHHMTKRSRALIDFLRDNFPRSLANND